jgi:isoquinoline 1-oxidoreductase alpha subunit
VAPNFHPVDVSPDTPLLWVLRDVLNYTGTKYGCGMGLCGACTVHLGRQGGPLLHDPRERSPNATPSPPLKAFRQDGQHPVQVAWEALDVPQCGYCQAGQIMSAAALLAHTLRTPRMPRSMRP